MKQIYTTKLYILLATILIAFQTNAIAQCPAPGASCNVGGTFNNGQTLYVNQPLSANVSLKNGAKMIIQAGGHYTGLLTASKGSTIEVSGGGRLEPLDGGSFATDLVNNGTTVLSASYTGVGNFSINNSSILTLSGAVSDNGKIVIVNTPCGTTVFNNTLTLQTTGSQITNEGNMIMKASVATAAAAGIINRGKLYFEGSYTGAGLVRNMNHIVFKGGGTFNAGDSLVNTHVMVFQGSVNVSKNVRNDGLFWLASGSLTVNNVIMRQNNVQALMRINGTFVNNSVFTAAGNLYLGSGVTNNGNIAGWSATNRLRVNTAINGTNSNIVVGPVTLYDSSNYVGGYREAGVCSITTLPVFFKEVKGIKAGGVNKITWSTSFEKNLDRFEIEHSTDGANFELIGTVTASRIATGSNYEFEHRYKIGGDHFYRVRSVDEDGTAKYSRVVALRNDVINQMQVTVAGNPFREVVSLVINSENNSMSTIVVYDRLGKLVKQQIVRLEKGLNNVQVAGLNSLPAGMCIVEVRIDKQQQTFKLVKQ